MSATTTPIAQPLTSSRSAGSVPAEAPAAPPSWQRLEEQIAWYSRGARRNKRHYLRIKVVQIVSAASIPVIAATSLPTWVSGALGALIVVLESVQQLFQFHSNWTHYRSTSEALKHEKFLYLAHAGSYATATKPDALLAERIESRVSQEHSAWASEQSQGQHAEVAMAQRIFISYRRDDSRGYAGRLQGDLSRRYSDEHVFRDVEIPPGADFGEYITGLVDRCNVVLAIIGPGWLDARDREGERRIDKPDDWVRLEIERALARDGVEVIPVLVDGARLPPREELPESLLALRRRNAFELSDRRWDYDVGQLGQHLDTLLRGTSALHVKPAGLPTTTTTTATVAPITARRTASAAEPADHTTFAVFAAAAVALLTAFPADLLARNVVNRAPLDRDSLVTVRDFVLEKAIFFGIAGALAALAVGFLSRRSREPIVSFLLGLGAGIVAGAVYAGAYAGLTLSSAEGTDTAGTAVGMIAAGAFLGWAFGAERAGSRLEASCAGLAGGLLAGGVVGAPARLADHGLGPPAARGPVRRDHRGDRGLRRPADPARLDRARGRAAHARSSSATGHPPVSSRDVRAAGEVERLAVVEHRAPAAGHGQPRALPVAHRHDGQHLAAAQVGAHARAGVDRLVGARERRGPPRPQGQRAADEVELALAEVARRLARAQPRQRGAARLPSRPAGGCRDRRG